MLEEIARSRYVVATVDHPYDANAVDFPHRRLVELSEYTPKLGMEASNDVRAQDISFVLDQSKGWNASSQFNTTAVIALGHGLGGAPLAAVLLNDNRIAGGMNINEISFGSLLQVAHPDPLAIPSIRYPED